MTEAKLLTTVSIDSIELANLRRDALRWRALSEACSVFSAIDHSSLEYTVHVGRLRTPEVIVDALIGGRHQ